MKTRNFATATRIAYQNVSGSTENAVISCVTECKSMLSCNDPRIDSMCVTVLRDSSIMVTVLASCLPLSKPKKVKNEH